MGRGFDPRWGHEETRQGNAGPAPAVPMFSAFVQAVTLDVAPRQFSATISPGIPGSTRISWCAA